MRKYRVLSLSLVLLLLCGCGTGGQVMDGDGMLQIDLDEETTVESNETPMEDPKEEGTINESSDVFVIGPYGKISVTVPDGWIAEKAPMDSNKMMYGLYGLILKPETASAGQIELFCIDMFGVCGTGLDSTQMELAGTTVNVGTYDNNSHWDFITFRNDKPQIVAQHTDCSSWTDAMWDEAITILDTMKFDEGVVEGGVGQFIPESENDEIAVIMEVTDVTVSGLRVHLRKYDKRDNGELICGEGYSLQVLNGDTWDNVPTIIDDWAFTYEGFIIPDDGETVMDINWEWLYGKLSPGTYRITKSVIDSNENNPNVNIHLYMLVSQFVIAG